jgi:hypothetical protein
MQLKLALTCTDKVTSKSRGPDPVRGIPVLVLLIVTIMRNYFGNTKAVGGRGLKVEIEILIYK